MKTNDNIYENGNERMSSLEIAELSGKPHNDVMKAIRKMEPAWAKITQGNFSLSEYKDKTGRTLPCYELTKTECLYIATKFNDEARARLVLRWEELERAEWERKHAEMHLLESKANLLEGILPNSLRAPRQIVKILKKGGLQ